MSNQTLDQTKVFLLVGGMGTRLRSVIPAAPKALAPVGRKSFLELLVCQLRNSGFRNLVMCSGYLAEQIENEFGDGGGLDVAIEYSRESTPMGTGGALKLAARSHHPGARFVVMNGDSFVGLNFARLLSAHRKQGQLVTMAVRPVQNASRYGTVDIDASKRVTGFKEKTGFEAPGLVNAGVYVFEHTVLQHIPDGPVSLERDVFPRLLEKGIYAQETDGLFIDIGTPEDYARAQQLYDRLYNTAVRASKLQ